jgi:hypothetical protein
MSAKVRIDATKPANFEGERRRLPADAVARATNFIAGQ